MHFYYDAHVPVASNKTNAAKWFEGMHFQTEPQYKKKKSNMYNIQNNHVQKLFYTQVLKNCTSLTKCRNNGGNSVELSKEVKVYSLSLRMLIIHVLCFKTRHKHTLTVKHSIQSTICQSLIWSCNLGRCSENSQERLLLVIGGQYSRHTRWICCEKCLLWQPPCLRCLLRAHSGQRSSTAAVTRARKWKLVPVSRKVLRTQISPPSPKKPLRGFKSSEVRPPLPGSLYSESGSVSPSHGLKCPVWARGQVSAPERSAKALETAGGSVRSPRSSAGAWGQQGWRAGRRSAEGVRDGPRFWWGWQTPFGCWCPPPAGRPAAFFASGAGGRGWRRKLHNRRPSPEPGRRWGWCRSWLSGVWCLIRRLQTLEVRGYKTPDLTVKHSEFSYLNSAGPCRSFWGWCTHCCSNRQDRRTRICPLCCDKTTPAGKGWDCTNPRLAAET